MSIIIKETNWNLDSQSLSNIRRTVFVEEQKVDVNDEWDGKDEMAIHFLAEIDQGKAVACARVLQEGNKFHIGRVAVLAEYRHQTIGRQLMKFMLRWCREHNPDFKIYLHAQTTRISFYEILGFEVEGDVFMDAGIEHVEMWYELK